jgi:hypothetical protein
VIRLLLFSALALAAHAEDVLPMRFANLPACAGPSATPRPKPEADGSFLLLRVQDPTGQAIDIYCAKEASGYNYQYRFVGPGGNSSLLDRCQLPDGISSVGVEHSGPVNEAALPNGGQWLRTPRLLRFFHHNWAARMGHHAIYDLQRQRLTEYATRAMQDSAGRWVRVFEAVHGSSLQTLRQNDPKATMGKNLPERTFDPNRISCLTALADEGYRIVEQDVDGYVAPQTAGKYTVAWPESSPIDQLSFDAIKRELRLKLKAGSRKTMVSIAFPRTMLGLGRELSHVRLDGRFVESDETTTPTHKSIRFNVDEPVKEILLTESQGFPFFAVTGIALLGAVIIGGIIGILFRRKLPAVADDSPSN